MCDELEERPVFPAPVRFPFAGTMRQARATVAGLSSRPPAGGIGAVLVTGETPGSRFRPVGAGVSERLAALPQPDDPINRGCEDEHEQRRRQAARLLRREQRRGGGPPAVDINNDDSDSATPVPVSQPAPTRRPPTKIRVEHLIQDVLVPCVRRVCGLPTSEALRSRLVSVSADIVGHDESSSRAILLRTGSSKRDTAIMWVSHRGGLLCSCLAGTHNALFLSTSSRSMDCFHSCALRTSLDTAGVGIDLFRSRMRLCDDPAPFARSVSFGASLVWTVLYRSVFSLVSFTTANTATCIAPACRRFRSRCGHVLAARAHCKRLGISGHGAAPPGAAAEKLDEKKAATQGRRARFLSHEEEDEGVEQLPLSTMRGVHETEVSKLSKRQARNMLPCHVEVREGEVWARTADWCHIYEQRKAADDIGKATELATHSAIGASMERWGLVRDLDEVLVEAACGSCGLKRGAEHLIKKEAGLLCTHHPTAPAVKVRLRSARLFSHRSLNVSSLQA